MKCNHCGGRVCVPAPEALVPALGCERCGRLVPVTGVKHKAGKRELNRALRAARRKRMAKGPE